MAYDRDGTVGFLIDNNTGAITSLAQATMDALNDESLAGYQEFPDNPYNKYMGLIFPWPMDLAGFFFVTQYTGIGAMEWSPDSTNGQDGTWTQLRTSCPSADNVVAPNYRTGITAQVQSGIKALRVRMSGGYNAGWPRIKVMHLYGEPSSPTDRLELWHPTQDQSLNDFPAWLEWGDRPRGTSQTKSFRIKNLSTLMTANNITVGMEAKTDAAPPLLSQHTFRIDSSPYAASVAIASLAPGAISSVVDLKQDLAANAALGLWHQRVYAAAAGWT